MAELSDFGARSEAARAHQRMDDHIVHDDQRFDALREDLQLLDKKLMDGFTGINNRLWWLMGLLLGGMGALALFLLNHAKL